MATWNQIIFNKPVPCGYAQIRVRRTSTSPFESFRVRVCFVPVRTCVQVRRSRAKKALKIKAFNDTKIQVSIFGSNKWRWNFPDTIFHFLGAYWLTFGPHWTFARAKTSRRCYRIVQKISSCLSVSLTIPTSKEFPGIFTWNFRGLGVGMAVVSFTVGAYYTMVSGWALYYFFNSFQDPLPWSSCPIEQTDYTFDNVTYNDIPMPVDECAKAGPGSKLRWLT